MRTPALFLFMFISLAACAHPGALMHAGFFQQREDPVSDPQSSSVSSAASTTASTTASSSSTSTSTSASASASTSALLEAPSGGDYTIKQEVCSKLQGDDGCTRVSPTGLAVEKGKCTAAQTFDFNVTYFYNVPTEDKLFGYGSGFRFATDWYRDCTEFMPTGRTLDGTWNMDKLPMDRFTMLEKSGNCALQVISLKKGKKLDLTFNDIFYAARDASLLLEAGEGRFSVGGMIRCDDDDNDDPDKYTYAWRLVPVGGVTDGAMGNTTIGVPYYKVKEPWKLKA